MDSLIEDRIPAMHGKDTRKAFCSGRYTRPLLFFIAQGEAQKTGIRLKRRKMADFVQQGKNMSENHKKSLQIEQEFRNA